MAREIVWTKRATKKFKKILEYLEFEWGSQVTKNFVTRTYTILDLIANQPEIGSLENQEKNIRGFLLTKQNRLFYRTTAKEIVMLNFFDTRSGSKRIKF